jgi:hypothetical protein
MKIHPEKAQVFHEAGGTDRRTNTQTDIMEVTFAFQNFATVTDTVIHLLKTKKWRCCILRLARSFLVRSVVITDCT